MQLLPQEENYFQPCRHGMAGSSSAVQDVIPPPLKLLASTDIFGSFSAFISLQDTSDRIPPPLADPSRVDQSPVSPRRPRHPCTKASARLPRPGPNPSGSPLTKRFCCSKKGCYQTFTRDDDLHRHVLEHHEKGNSLTCPSCGQQMLRRSVNRHQKICTKKWKFTAASVSSKRSLAPKMAEAVVVKLSRPVPVQDIPVPIQPLSDLKQLQGSPEKISGKARAKDHAAPSCLPPIGSKKTFFDAIQTIDEAKLPQFAAACSLKRTRDASESDQSHGVKRKAVEEIPKRNCEITVKIESGQSGNRILLVPRNRISDWLRSVDLGEGGEKRRISFWAR